MPTNQTRIQIVQETPRKHEGKPQLRLQWCRYLYADGTMEHGYRFIWLREDGSLQASRGQARIRSRQNSAAGPAPRKISACL